jgi:ketosteroid isomerase-like protein
MCYLVLGYHLSDSIVASGGATIATGGLALLRAIKVISSGLILSAIIAGFAVAAEGASAKKGEPRAIGAIRAVLYRQVAAWNRNDLQAFMEGYWRSPKLTFFSGGTQISGWRAILERYRLRYQGGESGMGQLAFSDLKIEKLGGRNALVRGRWRLQVANSEASGLFTLIFRRFPEGWKIIHDHTSS